MTTYKNTSPYGSTLLNNGYLDLLTLVDLPELPDDTKFTITSIYTYRPDLLANDLYGDVNLWWVFAVRNKNVIRDSIFDFLPGTVIYIPNLDTITQALK